MTHPRSVHAILLVSLLAACDSGVVADRDGTVDRPDAAMLDAPACVATAASESACTGAVDEDCDGAVDCADPDCDGLVCVAGAVCTAGGCVPEGTFPDAPPLRNVRTTIAGDRAHVTFEPVDGARDYRIYPLPAAGTVSIDPDGYQWIDGATYRCGGDREAQRTELSTAATVYRFDRTDADATLGHVFVEPGAGRIPVYRLGDPAGEAPASGSCWVSWASARLSLFTADEAERARLVGLGWRDDGVQFYAPAPGAGTVAVYHDVTPDYVAAGAPTAPRSLYYTHGPEHDARAGDSPTISESFHVLRDAAADSVPLLRVFYLPPGCNQPHDELAAGRARFERVLHQGAQPLWEVQWSGLTGPTTLVVEALDAGCPFQGHLSPSDVPARDGAYAQPFVTEAAVRATAAHGEVFVNGQHDPASRPRVLARSYVDVDVAAAPAMDWFRGFSEGAASETFTLMGTESHGGDDYVYESPSFHASLFGIEPGFASLGVVRGELWTSYADWGADVQALTRFTAREHAVMASDSFVHATMSVDLWSTGRRYPQIWISSVSTVPVQSNMDGGETLVVQPFQGWPTYLSVQYCDHRGWAVNDQCPEFATEPEPFTSDPAPPRGPVGEHAGVLRLARVDVYASTTRAYVFIDGVPWSCADLPGDGLPAGEVTITFGDALYHSGVDEVVVGADSIYPFHRDHMLTETRRAFDNLGFSSGVAEPAFSPHVPCGGLR